MDEFKLHGNPSEKKDLNFVTTRLKLKNHRHKRGCAKTISVGRSQYRNAVASGLLTVDGLLIGQRPDDAALRY